LADQDAVNEAEPVTLETPGEGGDQAQADVENPPGEFDDYVSATALVAIKAGRQHVNPRRLYQALARGQLASWVTIPWQPPCELQFPQSYWCSVSEQEFVERFYNPAKSAVAVPAGEVILSIYQALTAGRLYKTLSSAAPKQFELRFHAQAVRQLTGGSLDSEAWKSAKPEIRKAMRADLMAQSRYFAAYGYDLTLWGPDVAEHFGVQGSPPEPGKRGPKEKYDWKPVYAWVLRCYREKPELAKEGLGTSFLKVWDMAEKEGTNMAGWPDRDTFVSTFGSHLKHSKKH
jgi:hypothetical protein